VVTEKAFMLMGWRSVVGEGERSVAEPAVGEDITARRGQKKGGRGSRHFDTLKDMRRDNVRSKKKALRGKEGNLRYS